MRARLLSLGLLLVLLALPAGALPQPAPTVDRRGNPLPDGVIARLGSAWPRGPGVGDRLVYSPDGKLLASWDWRRITVWDARTAALVRQFSIPNLTGIPAPGDWGVLIALAFSPDRRFLVAGFTQGAINVWALGGDPPRAIQPLQRTVTFVGFTGESQFVVVSTWKVQILDVRTGKRIRGWDMAPGVIQGRAALAPDGTRLATITQEGEAPRHVRVWDVGTGEELARIEVAADQLAFGDSGTLAVLAERDVHILDGRDGRARVRWPARGALVGLVRPLAVSPDGRTIAALGTLHDATSGKVLRPLDSVSNPQPDHAAFSPDGRHLALAYRWKYEYNWGRTIEVQDTFTGKVAFRSETHSGPIRGMHTLPDGKTLATAATDGAIRLWNPRTGELLRRLDCPELEENSPKPAFGGSRIALVEGARVLVRDLPTGQVVRTREGVDRSGPLALSADGQTLLCCGATSGVQVIDVDTGRERCRFDTRASKTTNLALAPTGQVAAVLSSSDTILLGDTATGEVLFELETGATPDPNSSGGHALTFSPDGHLLAAEGVDGRLRLWDAASGKLLHEGTCSSGSLAFSADGRMLASTERDGTIRVRETATLEERFQWDGESLPVFAGPGLLASLRPETDVLIRDLPALITPDRRAAIRALWDALTDEDAAKGYQAIRSLIANPHTIPLLARELKPSVTAEAKLVRRLIAELDADDFNVRERAHRDLALLGAPAERFLAAARKTAQSPEQRQRLDELLFWHVGPPHPERVRILRAIEALEEIATPAAREILQRLAKGEPSALETQHARAALQRLGGPP
jgi:WD40 repeat protein